MSLQSRSVLFRQLLNTRECRTCSHFTAFSDNKFYTLHRNVFKSHPDTRSLRKLPTWATTQYLPHCCGKTPNSSIWVIPAVLQPGHDPPGWLRNPPWDFRWCFPALLTTLFIWTSWKWGSPASEKTKKKICVWLHRPTPGWLWRHPLGRWREYITAWLSDSWTAPSGFRSQHVPSSSQQRCLLSETSKVCLFPACLFFQ